MRARCLKAGSLVSDEHDSVDVREYVERIFAEREKQLLERFERQQERVDSLDRRIGGVESRLTWLIVIGSLLVAAAGLAGAIVGIVTK
jgi:hypothetical protein